MANQQVLAQLPESTPALVPDYAMSRVAHYIWNRGILVFILVHAAYKALARLRARAVAGDIAGSPEDIPVRVWFIKVVRIRITTVEGAGSRVELSLHPWRWLEAIVERVWPGKEVLTVRLGDLLAAGDTPARRRAWRRARFYIADGEVFALCAGLLLLLRWALWHGIPATVRTALRQVPVLLAVLIVVFATGDSWRIFGQEPAWRLAGLVVLLLACAGFAVFVNLWGGRGDQGGQGRWRSLLAGPANDANGGAGDHVFRTWAARKHLSGDFDDIHPRSLWGTPAEGEQDAAPLPAALERVRVLLERNVGVVCGVIMGATALVAGFWITVFFLVVGTVAISPGLTNDLLGGSARHPLDDVWLDVRVLGQEWALTRQLFVLAVALGAFAALNFATTILQDADSRAAVAEHALADLRGAIVALGYYLAGFAILLRTLRDARVLGAIDGIDADAITRWLDPSPPAGQ